MKHSEYPSIHGARLTFDTTIRRMGLYDEVAGICRYHGCLVSDITEKTRPQHVVSARRAVIQRLHMAGLSTKTIGALLGRCHSTIVFYLQGEKRKRGKK